MFEWLERRVDPFQPFDERTPPNSVWRFAWHYLKPLKGWLALIFVSNLIIAGLESALFLLIGWFVDLLNQSTPERIWAEHGTLLIGVAVLVAVVRPLLHFAHEAVFNQAITAQGANMIRWRTHVHTLGHALTYFQSDSPAASPTASCRPALPSATWPSMSSIACGTWRSTPSRRSACSG